jgi:hypothetical protein
MVWQSSGRSTPNRRSGRSMRSDRRGPSRQSAMRPHTVTGHSVDLRRIGPVIGVVTVVVMAMVQCGRSHQRVCAGPQPPPDKAINHTDDPSLDAYMPTRCQGCTVFQREKSPQHGYQGIQLPPCGFTKCGHNLVSSVSRGAPKCRAMALMPTLLMKGTLGQNCRDLGDMRD